MQKKVLLVWVAKIIGHSTLKKKINVNGAVGYKKNKDTKQIYTCNSGKCKSKEET